MCNTCHPTPTGRVFLNLDVLKVAYIHEISQTYLNEGTITTGIWSCAKKTYFVCVGIGVFIN
jgi:hypothetical protein